MIRSLVKTEKESNEINQIFDVFYNGNNPTINYANTTNRKAADFLIKKFGLEKTIGMAHAAVTAFGKEYAPRIFTPYQLREKLPVLIQFYRDQKKDNGIVTLS